MTKTKTMMTIMHVVPSISLLFFFCYKNRHIITHLQYTIVTVKFLIVPITDCSPLIYNGHIVEASYNYSVIYGGYYTILNTIIR